MMPRHALLMLTLVAAALPGCATDLGEPTAPAALAPEAEPEPVALDPVVVAEDFEMVFGTNAGGSEVLMAIVPLKLAARNATHALVEIGWDDPLLDLDARIAGPDIVEVNEGSPGAPDSPIRHLFTGTDVDGDYLFRITGKAPGYTAVHIRITGFFGSAPPEGYTAL